MTALFSHLRGLREVTLPDGSKALFRYQDTRVMSALMPLLDAKQRIAVLGPATHWVCSDPCGALSFIERVESPTSGAMFRLTPLLLTAVDEALLPYELLAQTKEADSASLGNSTPCLELESARRHISDARALGLASHEDLSLYGVLAFQLPPGFATLPPFDTAIAQAAGGRATLSQALNEADPRAWSRWNDLLAREDGM